MWGTGRGLKKPPVFLSPLSLCGNVPLHLSPILTWSKDGDWPRSKLICSLALTRAPVSASCALMKWRSEPNNCAQQALECAGSLTQGSLMTWGCELGHNSIDRCRNAFVRQLRTVITLFFHASVSAVNNVWPQRVHFFCLFVFNASKNIYKLFHLQCKKTQGKKIVSCIFRYVTPGMCLISMDELPLTFSLL